MEKRYQVFISSTFQDLQNARQEVSQALLRADCFPAGMELFPAADEEQFEFIKTVIDQSDYYIIISAGRYGTIHPQTGLSYTEMEYDYAVETDKPVIRLLHKDPMSRLAGEFVEGSDSAKAKLLQFREKLRSSALVRYWSDPKELGLEVVYGIMDARKRNPATGWVPAQGLASQAAQRQILFLENEITKLKLEIERLERSKDKENPYFEIAESLRVAVLGILTEWTDLSTSQLDGAVEVLWQSCRAKTSFDTYELEWILKSRYGIDEFHRVNAIRQLFSCFVALGLTAPGMALSETGVEVLHWLTIEKFISNPNFDSASKTPRPSEPSPHPGTGASGASSR